MPRVKISLARLAYRTSRANNYVRNNASLLLALAHNSINGMCVHIK